MASPGEGGQSSGDSVARSPGWDCLGGRDALCSWRGGQGFHLLWSDPSSVSSTGRRNLRGFWEDHEGMGRSTSPYAGQLSSIPGSFAVPFSRQEDRAPGREGAWQSGAEEVREPPDLRPVELNSLPFLLLWHVCALRSENWLSPVPLPAPAHQRCSVPSISVLSDSHLSRSKDTTHRG